MSDMQMDFLTNDIAVVNGDIAIISGDTAIQQNLQQVLQFWFGEWFLDTTQGIPYKQQILVKNPNLDIVMADLINAAKSVPGIAQITEYQVNFDSTNRTLSVFMEALTSNGQTITAQASINQPLNQTIQGTVYP